MDSHPTTASPTAELVFLPAPFTGHITSMLALAHLLADRHPRLSLTIFLMNSPFDPTVTAIPSPLPHPRVRFLHLPDANIPASTAAPNSVGAALWALVEQNKQPLRDAVAGLMAGSVSLNRPRLAAFVLDIFCMPMVDVATGFGAPSYIFYTSGAATLGLLLHLQSLYDDLGGRAYADFINSDAELPVPTFAAPIPLRQVLLPGSFKEEGECIHFFNHARRIGEARGILVNTFSELESHAVLALQKAAGRIPPIYPVGPILNLAIEASSCREDIAAWLDKQPASSVLLLCFGSMGSFEAEQVREIARGLERSGHRFLWSLRRPPANGSAQLGDYSDPEEVLPEGFLGRTAEVGRVIGRAPQAAVLSHASVGGFVSHCGWNSVLESLWFGVPIATWPLFAEQQMNAVTMARELGVAAEITMEYRKDPRVAKANRVVPAEEVERGIRRVMAQESEVRSRVKAMMELSRKAVGPDGSSFTAVQCFIDDAIQRILSASVRDCSDIN